VKLKCDPDYALELRSEYEAVQPGYHMHKKHWNTVFFNQDVPDKLILELINHSYELVAKANKKK
jgi:predicted DNA-binding protein (MmcQ/YjbR family)